MPRGVRPPNRTKVTLPSKRQWGLGVGLAGSQRRCRAALYTVGSRDGTVLIGVDGKWGSPTKGRAGVLTFPSTRGHHAHRASGLHHVTAIATDPQRNADFYRFALGLRLVKKTVNFDSPTPITCISVTNQDSRAPLSPSAPGRGTPTGRWPGHDGLVLGSAGIVGMVARPPDDAWHPRGSTDHT